jgi:hypothetical protein
MTLPKEIFAFVLIEYIQTKDFLATSLAVLSEKITYSNGVDYIIFDRNTFQIPIEKVSKMLSDANLDFEDFKNFCEYFLESKSFEIAMRQSIIKPKI